MKLLSTTDAPADPTAGPAPAECRTDPTPGAVRGWLGEPGRVPADELHGLTLATIETAEAALAQGWPPGEAEDLVEAMLSLPHLHHLRADCRPALRLAHSAVRLARHQCAAGRVTPPLCRVLSRQGVTPSETGHQADALPSLSDALRTASALDDVGAEAAGSSLIQAADHLVQALSVPVQPSQWQVTPAAC